MTHNPYKTIMKTALKATISSRTYYNKTGITKISLQTDNFHYNLFNHYYNYGNFYYFYYNNESTFESPINFYLAPLNHYWNHENSLENH